MLQQPERRVIPQPRSRDGSRDRDCSIALQPMIGEGLQKAQQVVRNVPVALRAPLVVQKG